MDSLNYHSDELRNLAFEQTIIRLKWLWNVILILSQETAVIEYIQPWSKLHTCLGKKKSIKQRELIFFLNVLVFGLLFMIFYVP